MGSLLSELPPGVRPLLGGAGNRQGQGAGRGGGRGGGDGTSRICGGLPRALPALPLRSEALSAFSSRTRRGLGDYMLLAFTQSIQRTSNAPYQVNCGFRKRAIQ